LIANEFALPYGLRVLRQAWLPHKLGVLDRLYGRRLSRAGVVWVKTANGPLWKLDLRSGSHRWIVYGDYGGPEFMSWARRWLRNGGVVIDSGANIGQTVLYFGGIAKTIVYAFEPNAEPALWLEECLEEQTGWNVEVIRQGLSNVPGNLELFIPDFPGEHGAQATLRGDWYGSERRPATTIRVDRLDTFITDRNLSNIRLWKLDVEGWEMNALQGAEMAFRCKAIDALFVELHPDNSEAVGKFIKPMGYDWFVFDSRGKLKKFPGGGTRTRNVVIMPV
jgi:FkbM family methyltransferase